MLNPHRQSVLANACVKASVDPVSRIPGTIYEPRGPVRLLGLISETSPSQQTGEGLLLILSLVLSNHWTALSLRVLHLPYLIPNVGDPHGDPPRRLSWEEYNAVAFHPPSALQHGSMVKKLTLLAGRLASRQLETQEEYLDAGDGMLICVKRAMKKPPESSRKGCSEPKNGLPGVDDISEAESDPDPNRQQISPIPEPNDTSLIPLLTNEPTKHPRSGSFPFHWMWESFSVKGQGVFHHGLPLEKTKKKWSPRTSLISVREPPPTPVPDSTGRKDNHGLGVSRSSDRVEETGARPPPKRRQRGGLAPGSSLFPLYWKMEARSEARKRQLRQERRRWLQLTQQLLNLEDKPPRRGKFLSMKQLEEKLRAELLCLATEPPEPSPQKDPAKSRSQPTKEEAKSKPTVNHKGPNFKNLQRCFREQLVQRRDGDRAPAKLTIRKPFPLHHANGSRALFVDEDSQDEEDPFHLWEPNWRAQSCPEFRPPMAHSVTRTKTSDKRQEANRLLLSEWERQERQEKRRAELRRAKEQQVQQDVAKCLATYRATGRSMPSAERRREELRKQEKQRMEEYMQQLQEMRERVESRPYLFERVMQANARQAVERRFSKVLATLGIDEETLWKKAGRMSGSKSSTKATHKRMEFLEGLTEST